MSATNQKTNLWTVLTIVVVVGLLAIAAARFVTAWAHQELQREVRRKVIEAEFESVTEYAAEQEALLEQPYAWVDREKGVVSLPITRAMELVATEDGASGGER